jgi:hypothetical protein
VTGVTAGPALPYSSRTFAKLSNNNVVAVGAPNAFNKTFMWSPLTNAWTENAVRSDLWPTLNRFGMKSALLSNNMTLLFGGYIINSPTTLRTSIRILPSGLFDAAEVPVDMAPSEPTNTFVQTVYAEVAQGVIVYANVDAAGTWLTAHYTTATNNWTIYKNASVARYFYRAICALPNGQVFLIGGVASPVGVISAAYEHFVPTTPGSVQGTWTFLTGSSNFVRFASTCTCTLSNECILLGGFVDDTASVAAPTMKYSSGTWSYLMDFPLVIPMAWINFYYFPPNTMVMLEGYPYPAEGHQNLTGLVNTFNIATSQWSVGVSLMQPRAFATYLQINQRVFVLGGMTHFVQSYTNEGESVSLCVIPLSADMCMCAVYNTTEFVCVV